MFKKLVIIDGFQICENGTNRYSMQVGEQCSEITERELYNHALLADSAFYDFGTFFLSFGKLRISATYLEI